MDRAENTLFRPQPADSFAAAQSAARVEQRAPAPAAPVGREEKAIAKMREQNAERFETLEPLCHQLGYRLDLIALSGQTNAKPNLVLRAAPAEGVDAAKRGEHKEMPVFGAPCNSQRDADAAFKTIIAGLKGVVADRKAQQAASEMAKTEKALAKQQKQQDKAQAARARIDKQSAALNAFGHGAAAPKALTLRRR